MLKRLFLSTLAVTLLLAGSAAALSLDGRCAIRFYGESTLHDFEGQVACQPFALQGEKAADGREIVLQPVVTVRVRDMDTDNAGRDEKMWKMFDSENFPEITGAFADLDAEAILQQLAENEQGPGTLEFALQIRDISQTIKADTRDVSITPEQISFTLEFALSLASYALEPPSVLGMIKVDDQVRVVARVILNRQPASAN